jgi:hypothetical protein
LLAGTLTVEEVYKDRDQFASLVREVIVKQFTIFALPHIYHEKICRRRRQITEEGMNSLISLLKDF